MVEFTERRHYKRYPGSICRVLASTDGKIWDEIEALDISAGGMKFLSSREYQDNQRFYFNLFIYNMLSEFNMKIEGIIIGHQNLNLGHTYHVKFDRIDKYHQIQLDEIIKSKILLMGNASVVVEDGVYSFLFAPRIKSKKFTLSKYR